MFSPVSRSSYLPEKIAAEISKEILLGNIIPGDKLPSEHALAKSFDVSRSVIREAIAQLKHEGLVETKQGLGAFVTEPNMRQSIKIDANQLADLDSFRSLFQLRIPLEVEAAGLAAKYAKSNHIDMIDETIEAMQKAKSWREESVPADLVFHRAIAEATNNEYFPMILGLVAQRLSSAIIYARKVSPVPEMLSVTIKEHCDIRQAIVEKNTKKARQAMYDHITNAGTRFKLNLDIL